MSEYSKKNSEKIIRYRQEYYQKTREKKLRDISKSRRKNAEKILQYEEKYRQKNRERIRKYKNSILPKKYEKNFRVPAGSPYSKKGSTWAPASPKKFFLEVRGGSPNIFFDGCGVLSREEVA